MEGQSNRNIESPSGSSLSRTGAIKKKPNSFKPRPKNTNPHPADSPKHKQNSHQNFNPNEDRRVIDHDCHIKYLKKGNIVDFVQKSLEQLSPQPSTPTINQTPSESSSRYHNRKLNYSDQNPPTHASQSSKSKKNPPLKNGEDKSRLCSQKLQIPKPKPRPTKKSMFCCIAKNETPAEEESPLEVLRNSYLPPDYLQKAPSPNPSISSSTFSLEKYRFPTPKYRIPPGTVLPRPPGYTLPLPSPTLQHGPTHQSVGAIQNHFLDSPPGYFNIPDIQLTEARRNPIHYMEEHNRQPRKETQRREKPPLPPSTPTPTPEYPPYFSYYYEDYTF